MITAPMFIHLWTANSTDQKQENKTITPIPPSILSNQQIQAPSAETNGESMILSPDISLHAAPKMQLESSHKS